MAKITTGKLTSVNNITTSKLATVKNGKQITDKATIGKWGKDIKFFVKDMKVLSFTNMKRKASARWATHNIIGKRAKTEFLGPGMDEIAMDIILNAELGVKPRKVMKKIRTACEKGEINYLYIGGKKVCVNKMAITDTSEAWERIWNRGELVKATVSVTFSEYR